MNLYTHADMAQKAAALEGLPTFAEFEKEQVSATEIALPRNQEGQEPTTEQQKAG